MLILTYVRTMLLERKRCSIYKKMYKKKSKSLKLSCITVKCLFMVIFNFPHQYMLNREKN